jgi:hypothetical protein
MTAITSSARVGAPGVKGGTCVGLFLVTLFFGISAAFWSGAVVYGLALASMAVISGGSAPAAPLETGEPRSSALVTASG